MVNIVKSFAAAVDSQPPLPPMPIAIDNGLPHISFDLDVDACAEPDLTDLMDTCSALNTGLQPFHQWLMAKRPDLVVEYHSFDDTNTFEPVKLGGVIRDPANFDAATHGNLTAIIHYYTPYTLTLPATLLLSPSLLGPM
jgi:hypothetical protein